MHRIVAFVMARGTPRGSAGPVTAHPLESAPLYAVASLPRQELIGDRNGVTIKAYPPRVLVAETTRTVTDAFSEDALRTRKEMIDVCSRALKDEGADLGMSEEYAIAIVEGYEGDIAQFEAHRPAMAKFLKSEHFDLHEKEIAHTLESSITYGKNNAVVVDWDGAFVFEHKGRTDAIVQLLQAANFQLLEYRMLDAELGRRLRKIEHLARSKAMSRVVFWNRELSRAFREVIRIRSQSIVEFDTLTQQIKLIGDWYSARLYDLCAKKFRVEEWKKSIEEKLRSLEDIYSIVSQNFRISREGLFEMALQFGWLTLILLELYAIYRS